METLKKVIYYCMLPIALVHYYVKKGVKYLERKSRPAVAMMLAVAVLCTMLPMTAIAVENVSYLDSTGASQVCSDYTTISDQTTIS